jgi:hypothetical protein
MTNLTKAYFEQNTQYYSESGNKLIPIDLMVPAYAANAARRLLMDAPTWQLEAGQEGNYPARWMLNTKLFQALLAQAQIKRG